MVSNVIRRAAAKKAARQSTPHERLLWRLLKQIPIEALFSAGRRRLGRMSSTSSVQPNDSSSNWMAANRNS